MANTPRLAPPPRPASGTRARTGRVLIVDDDARSYAALAGVLSGHLEVVVLVDPSEAVARIAAGERFDVVLCDLTMRGMTGAEIFARVCAVSRRQAGRIVFVSSGTMPLSLAEFLSRVDNPCLQRPFDLQVVRALVDRRVADELARRPPESSKTG
jgi:CheY-like chemotaxis protein